MDADPNPRPKLKLRARPIGGKAQRRILVSVINEGDRAATGVKLCVGATPKPVITGKRCRTWKSVGASVKRKAMFRVRTRGAGSELAGLNLRLTSAHEPVVAMHMRIRAR